MSFHLRTELLFPPSLIPELRDLREEKWQELVDYVTPLPETHPDALAFSYMMIKLCNCLNCDLGSYKASLGCSVCSQRTVSAVRDSNQVLMKEFKKAKKEVLAYLNSIGAGEQMAA